MKEIWLVTDRDLISYIVEVPDNPRDAKVQFDELFRKSLSVRKIPVTPYNVLIKSFEAEEQYYETRNIRQGREKDLVDKILDTDVEELKKRAKGILIKTLLK